MNNFGYILAEMESNSINDYFNGFHRNSTNGLQSSLEVIKKSNQVSFSLYMQVAVCSSSISVVICHAPSCVTASTGLFYVFVFFLFCTVCADSVSLQGVNKVYLIMKYIYMCVLFQHKLTCSIYSRRNWLIFLNDGVVDTGNKQCLLSIFIFPILQGCQIS